MANAGNSLPINVSVCGFQMSGTEWVYSMVQHILEDFFTNRSQKGTSRFLSCVHQTPSKCDKDVFKSHGKLILVVRHPKDTAVAVYEHGGHTCTFGDFLPHFIGQRGASYLSWVDFIVQWEGAIDTMAPNQVHVVYFNDLIFDLYREVKNLCNFLEVPLTSQLVEQVVSTYDLGNFFSGIEPERKRRKLDHTEARTDTVNLYEVDVWKQYFTVAQSEMFDHALDIALRKGHGKLDVTRLI